ncbi:Ig-like domain-containing protein [Algoriphagus terrigena]|uniref:Ig-like domain-containing protein n=1 Tax=Algoriphagus terrigena TaxID=344884 RepID=UPI0012FBEB8A|nr:Ig-like domain-containing protein [Algoriphagus terrigena]
MCTVHSLIFFGALLLISCSKKAESGISIRWEGDRAVGLVIPSSLLGNPDLTQLTIRLVQEGNSVPILGDLQETEERILFTPLIPFTRGESYEVLYGDSVIGTVAIPQLAQGDADLAVDEIYPTQDTLPENQLKFFVKFSKPMREGESVSHLTLLNSDNDTLKGVFLDLQPELWNEDQTILTVWLDPGRIKRDLIPNLEMGAPLEDGKSYRLQISDQWKGKNGEKLDQVYSKDFIVTKRDSIYPVPASWVFDTPKAGTADAVILDFSETLDYSLLNEVFKILNKDGQKLLGNWTIGIEEKSIRFTPETPWKKGKYILEIESRLEDLAGNNLNRLFEIDLLNQAQTTAASDFKQLEFEVKE